MIENVYPLLFQEIFVSFWVVVCRVHREYLKTGTMIKVIEPYSLRNRMQKLIKDMYEMYTEE